MEKESEMAGEVEASGEPLSGRNKEHGSAIFRVLRQMPDGCLESFCVGRRTISNSSEICQGRAVSAAAYGAVPEVIMTV